MDTKGIVVMPVYMLITEDGCDQIVETKAIANREAHDLHAMGCTVRVKEFPGWTEAEAYEDKLRGY